MTPDGSPVKYACQVDLLAVDDTDEYWIVFHQIVEDWQDAEVLIRDEEAVAACWAWEQDYLGMTIAGTIHNEVRISGPLKLPSGEDIARGLPRVVAQHEPSGGGRSIPQHERVQARASRVVGASRMEQRTAGVLRRTRIRRTRDEIAAAAGLIAAEAVDMTSDPAVYPTFAAHCRDCEFAAPCLVMIEGADPGPVLAADFRRRVETNPSPGWVSPRGASAGAPHRRSGEYQRNCESASTALSAQAGRLFLLEPVII